jgi:hypothetical protein
VSPSTSPHGSRVSRPKVYSTQAAKDKLVELIRTGVTVKAGLEKVGRAQKTYEEWRRTDPDFKARIDQARQLRGKREDVERGEKLGFAEWRKKYLHQDTFWHQHQWIDMLEGREPRDLHPAQTYEPANRNRLLVNVPPEHAKTTTISTEYAVYRLCMDPSYRILIISAGQGLANSIVYDIQQILTSPDYIDLQKAYAPDGGWEANAESWRESQIIFGSDTRASGSQDTHQKDPNVLALGMRSKIYGRRADLVIVDDGVDTTNVSEYAKQMTWLRKMVESRIVAKGRLIVVGTRIASVDLYSELRKPENYANGRSPWTYFAAPAILEEGATPEEHVTLWPKSSHPLIKPEELDAGDVCICNRVECAVADSDGLYSKWDGIHLEAGPRSSNNNADWALVYMQKSVPEDATFPEHAVTKAIQNLRLAGRLESNQAGHPYSGMHGKYVIASLDPSIKGFAGIIVGAVDRETQKRHVMNAWNLKAPTKDQLVEKMKQVTEHYSVNEWRVEKTGLLQFFTQDSAMRMWFSTRGVRFTEHHTGSNKWDAGFGVSSLASLFGEYDKAWNDPNAEWREITAPLIELPRINTDGIKALVHQLITWTPELDPGKVPCDMVMALWFFEIGAREHLGYGKGTGTVTAFRRSSKYVSPRKTQQSTSVRLADYHGLR